MEWIVILMCLLILVITLIIYKQNSGSQSIVNKELKEQNEALKIASGRLE